jgi:hypothetical protein
MSKKKSIIPEFMVNNPDDTFQFLFPLKIILDEDKFGNSHYEVVVKNMNSKEVFTYQVSPELLFTHYPLCKSFKNGERIEKNPNKDIIDKSFKINTKFVNEFNLKKLKHILDKKTIGTLLGWNYKFYDDAKNINCYLIEQDDIKIIIPHFTIGIYYYFRFSQLREAVLDSTLNELYIMCENDRANAKIVLPTYRTDEDTAFIHRYACQKDAIKEFDNVSRYIHNYLKYMQENNFDVDIYKMHLKFNFPIKDEFPIDTRSSLVTNKETNEQYYFIHEITNDYSDIGFEKLTKIIESNKVILNLGDIENLPKVEKDIPNETSEILKITHASKKNTQTYHQKDRKESCGSLENIDIEEKSSTRDIIEDLLRIYKEQQTDEITHQSLTESSSKGNKTIRKVVISSEFVKESRTKPLKEIDNFIVFNQYINFLQQRIEIKDFLLNEKKDLPQYTLDDNDGETKINPKCKIKKRPRQYLTATFKYENSYVGLLELENNPSSGNSTWVIISDKQINTEIFDFFMNLYFKKDMGIDNILKKYSQTNPKFTKKNHERNENLDVIQIGKWYAGLLGKFVNN